MQRLIIIDWCWNWSPKKALFCRDLSQYMRSTSVLTKELEEAKKKKKTKMGFRGFILKNKSYNLLFSIIIIIQNIRAIETDGINNIVNNVNSNINVNSEMYITVSIYKLFSLTIIPFLVCRVAEYKSPIIWIYSKIAFSSWEEFKIQFEVVARLNAWKETIKITAWLLH